MCQLYYLDIYATLHEFLATEKLRKDKYPFPNLCNQNLSPKVLYKNLDVLKKKNKFSPK